ncbi:MAG: energy transducer TonB [Gemmatimonadaceae bacterium]
MNTRMFNTLIESKPKKERRAGGALASVVLHALMISGVVYATANAGQQMLEERREEDVQFVQVTNEPPPPEPEQAPPPPDVVAAPPPPKGFQVLTAPINIPDKLPDIDLSKAVTDEADFSGRGVAGGVAKGVVGGTGPVNQDQPYFEFQVEKQTLPYDNNPRPRFPDILQSSGAGGEVLVQFVVDTSGRAEMNSLKILKSTNELLTREVRSVLPRWRFYPAEVGGRKVRQLVQLPFSFNLNN